ncbi:MAG: hypothetical protein OEZ68_00670 [Gammaproteobacteria bacterium]|nr:hypothetical protein [Gammaproteobacteria bacterium]MDH5799291.1 hypothetical protein [Gammaproteobacteria bacterium]
MRKYIISLAFVFVTFSAFAGVDVESTVERVQIKGDGNLWIKMTDARFDQYCRPGWFGFNLYIPVSDKSYPYYYGLVTTALSKGQRLYIANISVFDGTQPCDLTQTGYGVVLKKP